MCVVVLTVNVHQGAVETFWSQSNCYHITHLYFMWVTLVDNPGESSHARVSQTAG